MSNPIVHICDANHNYAIEYQWLAPERTQTPLLVFLHEGLGSVSHWGPWPAELIQQLQCRGLLYSRVGYGASSPRPAQKLLGTNYLHIEAQERLPALLQALALEQQPIILVGHSDGATIALLYAALAATDTLQGIITIAPHITVEEKTTAGVKKCGEWYEHGDLKQRLQRYHADVDSAFYPWFNAWTHADFQSWSIKLAIQGIQCPVLAVQGEHDEYASLEQVYGIQRIVPHTEVAVLPKTGHSPHLERPVLLSDICQKFIQSLG